MTEISAESLRAERVRIERLAYGYELMHRAICYMAGTSGPDGHWYMKAAQEVLGRVSPVWDITPDSNPPVPGDCLYHYKTAIPRSCSAGADALAALAELDRSGILGTAESNASGMPNWEFVSKRINAARAPLSLDAESGK